MTTTDHIRPPWTPDQVATLNAFQERGGMHPFTCGNDQHPVSVVLMARRDGWHCPDPACDYRQFWAHAFMADREAWSQFPFGELRRTPAVPAAVSPPPDRAFWAAAADYLIALRDRLITDPEITGNHLAGIERGARELRRLAAEAPQQPERCPHGCDVTRCPCLACEADKPDTAETPRIMPDPDRDGVILHLPEITYLDTQVWAVDIGLTDAGLRALQVVLNDTEACGRLVSLPGPCSAGDWCCKGPGTTEQQPAAADTDKETQS